MAVMLFIAFDYSHAQINETKISIPTFNDEYTKTVVKLESGTKDVDFVKFRFSFLDSKQYDVKNEHFSEFDSLQKLMFAEVENKNYKEVIAVAKKILSIDYTNLWAQKFLRQSYAVIGDSANANKYKNIELGLLRSIYRHSSGEECGDSWEAAQVYEEYFVLDMIGAHLKKQSINQSSGSICDEMEVEEKGVIKKYYFDIEKMMLKKDKKLSK